MKGYSARYVFTREELDLHARATTLVAGLPDPTDVDDVRCHELARAVGSILDLQVVDGHYCLAEHSWLLTGCARPDGSRTGSLLDVYAVASLPPVQLVYQWPPRLQRGHSSRYVERRGGLAGIAVDETVVTRLKETMLRNEHDYDDVQRRWDKRTTTIRALRAFGQRLVREHREWQEDVDRRADGRVQCDLCGLALADHPSHPVESMAWATVLCDGGGRSWK